MTLELRLEGRSSGRDPWCVSEECTMQKEPPVQRPWGGIVPGVFKGHEGGQCGWSKSPLHVSSVQFSLSVVSNSLWPHELQHARPPCPSPTPRVYPNSCPLSGWCHPTISSSVVPFSCPVFPSIRVFSNESALRIRWPKYWNFSFSISPSNEHSGLISFRMDWWDLLAVQGTLKSLLEHHSPKA